MIYFKSYAVFENVLYGNSLPTKDIKVNYDTINKTIDFVLNIFGEKSNLALKQFLIEIAMVESYLGTANGSIRTTGDAGRGAWQIDQVTFKETKANYYPQLKKYLEALKKAGIDWINLKWNDCNQFLYGLITARLLFAMRGFKPDPNKLQSRVNRAELWKKLYNTSAGKGTPQIYWQKVKETYQKLGLTDPYKNFTYEQAKEKGVKDSFAPAPVKNDNKLKYVPKPMARDNTNVSPKYNIFHN